MNTLLPFGAAIWARLNGHRVVYHVHESSLSPALLGRFLTWVAQACSDLVIYVSEDNRRRVPIETVKSVVVPNPVLGSIADAAAKLPFRERRSGSFRVLMLASPRDYKGVPEFFALAQKLSSETDIEFDILFNAEWPELNIYLKKLEFRSNVNVYSRSEKPENFYARANLVLNLTRVDLCVETFGLTLVEAMSFGIPVVAPPVGGPADLIADGQEGFLVDSRDIASLERKIRLLKDDPELMLQMSVNARRRASEFSLESFYTRLREALASIEFAKA
ncbi:glycosyltransferase family 4 protein [Sphingomicrobium astaxanthinifaciens]|uniref:glycosyltransferase family 4 protein n=1 Tax=Sphingomicrobium astaxanthinifaciens TaxID=1227949 RepID=UPI001FCA7D7C|nr:glycosyltransferase family 4 protein [Sphingomicrobium astaxanthinifaciens]